MTNPLGLDLLKQKEEEQRNPLGLDILKGSSSPTPASTPQPENKTASGIFKYTQTDGFDNLDTVGAKAMIRGATKPFANVVDFLAKGAATEDAPILKIQDKVHAFMSVLEPVVDPRMETRTKIVDTTGYIIGNLVPIAKVFGTTQRAAEAALETVAPKALNAIGQVAAQSTGRIWVGNIARALPANVIAGVAGQAVTDPESMETARGFITVAGLSGAGALLSYKPNALARGSAEALPDYSKRIQGLIAGEQQAKETTAKELFQRAYEWGVDAKAPVKRQFNELNRARVAAGMEPIQSWKDPGKLMQIASGSGGMAERALFGDGHFYLDEGGNVVKTTESLAFYLKDLKRPEDVEQMKRVALALHTLDEGVVNKTNELRRAKEDALARMDQFALNIVKSGWERGLGKDEVLKEVYQKLQTRQHINDADVVKAYDLFGELKRIDSAITGITPADARQEIANAPDHIRTAAENLAMFRREGNLKYIQTKGLLSEEAAQKWNELYENYVSLERVFSNTKDTGNRVFEDVLGTKSPTFLKEQTGSRRAIKDVLATTIEQTRITFKRGNENWITQQFANIVKEDPDSWRGVFEIVPDASVPAEHIEALADKLIASAKDASISMGRKEAREIASFMSPTSLNPTSNTINFFENGIMRTAKVSDEIARAYKSMAPQDMNFLVKLMGLPAKGVRTGVTLSLDFLGYNLIADTYSAWLKSNHGFQLGLDTGRGLMEAIKDTNFIRKFGGSGSAVRQEALAGGVGMGTLSASKDLADPQLLRKILPQTAGQRVFNTVSHPLEALKSIAKPLEEATRIGEYMRARQAGKDVTTAALAYRNITTDFAQMGGGMKSLAHMTAFLNPAIQSLNADTRAVIGRDVIPVANKKFAIPLPNVDVPILGKVHDWQGSHVDISKFMHGVTTASKLSLKGFGGLSIPSAILWAVNHDDEEINDLRKSESGAIYWHIRKDDNTILRVRKPFLFGQIFATGMEQALDAAFDKDPNAMKGWIDGVKQQAVFAGIPNAVQIGGSLFANKDWHTNAPIIPTEQLNTAKEYQGTEQTSQLSKLMTDIARKTSLGKVNISPIQMDYVIRSSTGSLGSNVTKSADFILPKSEISAASPTKTDLPMIGRFFARYPSQSVEPVRTFYDNLNKAEEVVKTAKRLEDKNPGELANYLEKNVETYSLAPIYTETKQQLADIRHTIDEIVSAPDDVISRDEKRTYVDMYMRQIIEITRAVNSSVGR